MDLTIIAHERTPFTEGWLLDSRLDAAIAPKQILCHSATLPAALQPLDRGLRSERRTP